MLHEESGNISCFQSSLFTYQVFYKLVYQQITNYKLIPIDNVRMISYDMIRRKKYNTAVSVPRSVCSCIELSCAVKKCAYRPVPSWKQKCTVPCRQKKKKYRPFPSWKKLCTVPSRREKLYAPSRPVERKKIPSRPVVIILFPVPSRRDNFYLPSRPVVTIFIYRPVPS